MTDRDLLGLARRYVGRVVTCDQGLAAAGGQDVINLLAPSAPSANDASAVPRAPRRVLAVGYLLFLAITVVSWVGLDLIAARFADVDLANINQRPAIWADTITIAKDFWLTGTGLNTYGVSTLFYQTSVPGHHLREAHNDYLQLAAEGGLLLGVPILLTVVAFAWEVLRRLRQDEGSIWWIRMGAITGMIAIAMQAAVEFSLQMPGNAALFAVIAGMAIHDGRRV